MEFPEINIHFADMAFYLFATISVLFAGVVAFGRNIIYSAFSLLGCFAGVAGIYILLSADFVSVLQVFVYVGGITVLIIFAVMFTKQLGDVKVANQSMNWKSGFFTIGVMFLLLYFMIKGAPWVLIENPQSFPTTNLIGNLLITDYVLPFELISLVLLVALIGAIVVARKDHGRQREADDLGSSKD